MKLKSRVIRWNSFVAVQLLNTFYFLVLLNIVLYGVFSIVDRSAGTPQQRFELNQFREVMEAYPGWDESELAVLIANSRDVTNVFDPFTQFRVGQYSTKYVNVDPVGFRWVKHQGPWPPPEFNVFLFGGSTTFGLGVPDDQTIASFLQEFLGQSGESNVYVYNFGKLAHFSTQERTSFEQLVADGHGPDLAVFVDGLNEFIVWQGVPLWSSKLSKLVDQANQRQFQVKLNWYSDSIDVLQHLPLYRVARNVKGKLNRLQDDGVRHDGAEAEAAEAQRLDAPYQDETILADVIKRWLANKDMIELVARGNDIRTIFVFQPVPTYNYDIDYHFAANGDLSYFGRLQRARYGYELFDQQRSSMALGENFLWLGDMQEGRRENLYVDRAHYTAAFSKEIASRIYDHIIKRSLLPNSTSAQSMLNGT